MPKAEEFKITYGVEDGYVGPDRPHYTSLTTDDLCGDETDDDLKKLFWGEIQRHFEENVTPYSKQEAQFVAWAREHMPKDE